jgi:carotenoid cleavage dioxygenase-like enzyme
MDSENFSAGPVCRLNLKHHVTYGLHGSFTRQQVDQQLEDAHLPEEV